MAIKLAGLQKVTRETTATIEVDGGSETIRIQYRSPTLAEIRKEADEQRARSADDPVYLSDVLARRVVGLPDIVDDKGKPVTVSVELFDGFTLPVLMAISEAISADMSPKLQPVK